MILLRSDDRPWRLDERTREVGRRGLQDARAALRQAATGDGAPARHVPDRRLPRRTAA